MVVMSQWAHSPWNLESPETPPAWSVAMAARLPKQEEAERRCPVLCVRLLSYLWPRKWGAGRARAHG
jgi:hypothetical protein